MSARRSRSFGGGFIMCPEQLPSVKPLVECGQHPGGGNIAYNTEEGFN